MLRDTLFTVKEEEIFNQLDYIREWNGKFVVAIPKLEII